MSKSAFYHIRARRRERRNESEYDGFVASPFDMSLVPFTAPANAELAFSFSTGLAAGAVDFSINGRTVSHSALSADQKFKIGYVEKDQTVEVTDSPAGTLTLYLVRNNGVFAEIANGSFA